MKRVSRAGALAMLCLLACPRAARADPEDFQAIQGLWKITLHASGHITVRWRCFYDGADPWTVFVDPLQPAPQCHRDNARRSSIALAWTLQCGAAAGEGRLQLDTENHFAAQVGLRGKTVLRAEGQRYAACTGPAD